MATKLEKDITRETKVKVKEKEILITLTEDQKIKMKLKGTRNKYVSIDIMELWEQLNPNEDNNGPITIRKENKKNKNDVKISLYELRSHSAISDLDYNIVVKFDEIIRNLIKLNKN